MSDSLDGTLNDCLCITRPALAAREIHGCRGRGVCGALFEHAREELAGEFTIATPSARLELSLEVAPDGSVRGTVTEPGVGRHALSGTLEDDEVLGDLESPQRQGELEVYFDEDVGHYFFVFTPKDTSGTLLVAAEAEWPMVRGQGEEAVAALARIGSIKAATPADPSSRDPRLVGRWRTTSTISDSVGGVVQDLFMEFRADGTFREWSGSTVGGFGGVSVELGGEAGEQGRWRTDGDRLDASLQNSGWLPLATFTSREPACF